MANASFTRDEAILALDVLYFSDEKHLTKESKAIDELCDVLQKLPIHPQEGRSYTFRNRSGVANQLISFKRSLGAGKKDPNVGDVFYKVYLEYENDMESLHAIAGSIHRNIAYFNQLFGNPNEMYSFPEGALLDHLHRMIEHRDGGKIFKNERCEVCSIELKSIYSHDAGLLESHLLTKPEHLDGTHKYASKDFLTVCPNCHAALHRYRPWLVKNNCHNLLTIMEG